MSHMWTALEAVRRGVGRCAPGKPDENGGRVVVVGPRVGDAVVGVTGTAGNVGENVGGLEGGREIGRLKDRPPPPPPRR